MSGIRKMVSGKRGKDREWCNDETKQLTTNRDEVEKMGKPYNTYLERRKHMPWMGRTTHQEILVHPTYIYNTLHLSLSCVRTC